MLTISSIFLLLSNAVTLKREKSILYSRIVIKTMLLTSFIAYINLHVKCLENGIGIFGSLFNITTFTQSFNILIFILNLCLLTLTAFSLKFKSYIVGFNIISIIYGSLNEIILCYLLDKILKLPIVNYYIMYACRLLHYGLYFVDYMLIKYKINLITYLKYFFSLLIYFSIVIISGELTIILSYFTIIFLTIVLILFNIHFKPFRTRYPFLTNIINAIIITLILTCIIIHIYYLVIFVKKVIFNLYNLLKEFWVKITTRSQSGNSNTGNNGGSSSGGTHNGGNDNNNPNNGGNNSNNNNTYKGKGKGRKLDDTESESEDTEQEPEDTEQEPEDFPSNLLSAIEEVNELDKKKELWKKYRENRKEKIVKYREDNREKRNEASRKYNARPDIKEKAKVRREKKEQEIKESMTELEYEEFKKARKEKKRVYRSDMLKKKENSMTESEFQAYLAEQRERARLRNAKSRKKRKDNGEGPSKRS